MVSPRQERGIMEIPEEKQEAYSEAIHRFYEAYLPIKRKYDLYMHAKSSIYEDTTIDIYKLVGSRKEYVVRLKESDDVEIYKRAREEILNYDRKCEEVSGNLSGV